MLQIIRHVSHRIWNVSNRNLSSDTIFSLSSGQGKCGVAVIRVSGTGSLAAVKQLTSSTYQPKPRYASLKSLVHPRTGDIIDKGLVLWFPGPRSFTGEDSCEFQVHGGLAIVHAMLDALSFLPNLRQAMPGEFTKRAFYNGKIDLTEVEGLADVIHAETEYQRQQALLQSAGVLSKLYQHWREKLMLSIAYLEATIDFAEDQDIDNKALVSVEKNVQEILVQIRSHLNDHRQGEILRDGVKTVIIGAPNVGKSSFLNWICQRNISIVTSIAGTTRDIIESFYDIGGYPVVFQDTAGLRLETNDVIEQEGISRSVDRIKSADLILLILNATDIVKFMETSNEKNVRSYIIQHLNSIGLDMDVMDRKSTIIIANKVDLLESNERSLLQSFKDIIPFSCKTKENMIALLDGFTQQLKIICGKPTSESPRLSKLRYRHLLTDCVMELEDFLEYLTINSNTDLAITAQKLRSAVRLIGQITGDVSTEQILDIIFKDFCIGK